MKKLKKIVSIIMLCVMTLGTCFISTGCSNSNNGLHKDSSLSQTKSGGGGATPSPDKIDNVYPQPEPQPGPAVEGPIIPDEDKVNWNDAFFQANVVQQIVVDSSDPEYRNLPVGYTQIKNLVSSGSQYIDTGLLPTQNANIEVDFMSLNIGEGKYLFGTQNGTNRFSLNHHYQTTQVRVGTYAGNVFSIQANTKYNVKINNGKIYFDDVEIQSFTTSEFVADYNLLLFALNNSGSATYKSFTALYSCKIYDGETLVRDFVPCYNSSYVFGLYDVVNDVFYTNQGTGSFNSSYNYAIQGSGTQADPYQISSAMDLAYFSYNKGKVSGKYLKLMKDIVLNDGTFEVDENYNIIYHDGGDGKLYEWTPIQNANSGAFLDGNGHTIKGLYINNATLEYGGLFDRVNTASIYYANNLKLEDIYIHAINAYSISYSISSGMKNTELKSGCLIGEKKANGFCSYQISGTIENCVNRANILKIGNISPGDWDGSSGFAREIVGRIVNCKNYGNIHAVSNGGYAGGFFCRDIYAIKVNNCANYGNITGSFSYVGGFSSASSGFIVNNWKNYGNVSNGFVGTVGSTLGNNYEFTNCYNYGNVSNGFIERITWRSQVKFIDCINYGKASNGFVGSSQIRDGYMYMINCKNKGFCTNAGFVGGPSQSNNSIYNFINCCNEGNVISTSWRKGGFIAMIENSTNIKLKFISCLNNGNVYASMIVGGFVGGVSGTDLTIDFDKCVNNGEIKAGQLAGGLINGNCTSMTNCVNNGKLNATSDAIAGLCTGSGTITNCLNFGEIKGRNNVNEIAPASAIIKNCISDCIYKNERKRSYWGTDFSAFFLTWKDRRIGLIAIENTGLYRGKLTETYLRNKDFEKVA